MTTDANRNIVQQFFERVLSELDPDAAERAARTLIDPAVVIHHAMLPGGTGDLAALKEILANFRRAFPDLAYTLEDVAAEGDRVAVRWTARGTNDGPFMGVQPTHRPAAVGGADFFIVRNERIVETWVNSDLYGLLAQLGATVTV